MTTHFAADVLICGAGAAGLTLAIDLARRNITFRLIEKMPVPFHGSRGKGIQPRTQEVFEDLGIIDKVVAAGGEYPPMRVYREDGSFVEKDLGERSEATPAEPFHIPLMIPQFLTERIMRQRLVELGGHVEFGCELIGFEQDQEGVTAQVSGPGGEETVRVRYLLGADGGGSFVRKALGVGFPGKTLGVRALVADVTLTGLDQGWWHQFNDSNMERMISICPLAGTNLFQLQAPVPQEGEVDLSAGRLERMIAERTHAHDIGIQSVNWASVYQMNARLADRYRVDRVFLVGDAAHIHPPTGGQGLNTSVQDAYNLGWKLAAILAGAHDALLNSYEIERRPVAETMLGLSTRLLDASRLGEIKRGREVRQLDIGYPESPLSMASRERVGLRAGDRAPDAPIVGAAGQPSRLFQLFRGPHWTLLINGQADFSSRPGLQIHRLGRKGDIVDAFGHVGEAYQLQSDEGVLVRPDGYIAGILPLNSDGVARLEAYLGRIALSFCGEGSR
nr:FAD-binding protein [Rhizobium sp. Q54]